jgi:hypothetical protein
VALAVIAIGIATVVEPFAYSLFSEAPAGQRIIKRFGPTLSSEGLHSLVTNFATVGAMGNQLFGQTLPDVRRQLHMTPAQFEAYLRTQHPAIAHAQVEVPAAVALVGPVNPQLVAVHDDFEQVKSLPGLFGLPLTSVPWLLVVLGGGLIALGMAALVRPGSLTAGAIAVTGLALVAIALALSLPTKADAAVHVDKVGKVALSPVAAKAGHDTSLTLDALVNDVQQSFIPDLSRRLGVPPATLSASIEAKYPAVAKGLAAWPSIRPGAFALSAAQQASLPDRPQLDNTPFRVFPWFVIGPGIALALLGAAALLPRRAPQPAAEPA